MSYTKMNYLLEILAFHDLVAINQLSTGQIALWHALMYINNKCAWQEWFTVSNRMLESHTGLTRDGIAKARNKLRQKGYIEFKSNGTAATAYTMIQKVASNNLQDGIQVMSNNLQDSLQPCLQDSTTLNKLKQNKTEKSTRKVFSPPTKEEVAAYCRERNNGIDAQTFVDFYAARGWVAGKVPMKDWRAAVRTWESRRKAETAEKKGWESFE